MASSYLLIATEETPPFINGIKTILEELCSWMLILVPVVIILTFIIGGLMLAKAEDGMETKAVKGRMFKSVIGAALAGGATWIGNHLWSAFGG